MSETKDIPLDERIILALDVPSAGEARRLVEALSPGLRFFKVGLQLFLAAGFPLVEELAAAGLRVMLDLKFFDVPSTVAEAVRQVSGRGVAYTTVHGDDAIMEAAAGAARDVGVLAVTVLTSLDDADLKAMGYGLSAAELVAFRAKRAKETGCRGVVCSGREAAEVRKAVGPDMVIVTPGIRAGAVGDDQKRTLTPADAILAGADHLVVGRPLREARNPLAAAEMMQREIASALEKMET